MFVLVFLYSVIVCSGSMGSKNSQISKLSYDEIKKNLLLSYSAYCPSKGDHGIADWKCWWCKESGVEMENTKVFLDEKSQLLVYGGTYNDDNGDTHLIIGFRGTPDPLVSLVTFIYDADFRHTNNPYGAGKIMKGFEECFKYIEEGSVNLVKEMFTDVPSISKMTVTGHSLGGCLADLALIRFVKEIEAVKEIRNRGDLKLMHFGSPRLGDDDFVQFFLNEILGEDYIFRVTFENDVAPHFPPRNLEYHHVPTEIWFRNNSTSGFVVCDGTGEDGNCADSFKSVIDLSYRKHFGYLGIELTEGAKPPHWCIDSGR